MASLLKLGKLPARPDAVKLKFSSYKTLPTYPTSEKAVDLPWQMLGNDTVGDCVLAGAGHETMAWNHEANKTVTFTDKSVLSDYSAITGYNPNDPNSDQGTDMVVAASYRKKTGVVDANGVRHKVGAYVALTVGDTTQVKEAIYLFGAVGIGFQFPDYAMDEFNNGETWHLKTGGTIQGGHYVPAIGYSSRYLYVVTWGKLQRMTWGFYRKYSDESIAYLSPEFLTGGQSLEGFNLPQLQTDLQNL
jgi:hypothetical protein